MLRDYIAESVAGLVGISGVKLLPLFFFLLSCASYGQYFLFRMLPPGASSTSSFQKFQKQFLIVYLLMVTADWLQGPYIYALYEEYGISKRDIGILFVIGFGTSGITGAVIGTAADKFGRKKTAIAYSVLYGISCLTKHSDKFNVLALGRVSGGMATSILFSVFDAWMVHEHKANGHDSNLLGQTFAYAAFGNGVAAIVSAIMASLVAQQFGKVAPFDLAILFLIAGGFVVGLTWPENFGANDSNEATLAALKRTGTIIVKDPSLLLCGAIQSLFEGGMYTFVLMWTPALPSDVNHGIVFGSFMVAVMLGSQLFRFAKFLLMTNESILLLAFGISTLTMAVPVLTAAPAYILSSFIIFEVMVGIYFSAFYTIRSMIVPDDDRATILNYYRVPLNAIVLVVCYYSGTFQVSTTFAICFLLEGACFACMLALARQQAKGGKREYSLHPVAAEMAEISTPED